MVFCTLSAIFLAFVLFFIPIPLKLNINWNEISFILIFISIVFFCLFTYLQSILWISLQKGEKNFTPHLLDLYKKDRLLRFVNLGLETLPLLSIFLTIVLLVFEISNKIGIFCFWIVLLGIAIDFIRFHMKQIQSYINPYTVISMMTKRAKYSIEAKQEKELCDWIDAISEISIKAVPSFNTSLANAGVNELQNIANFFLKTVQNKELSSQNEKKFQSGSEDKANFILFYLFQRLELINTKAVNYSLEPICSNILTNLGKITLGAVNYDISLTTYPIHYLGKFSLFAQQNRLEEVGIKASLTLYEVAKSLLEANDLTYLVIKDPFFSLIIQMHEIAKEIFKQNKNTRIDILTQPFRELNNAFKSEKMIHHQDSAAIINKIEGVLAEFSALELVLRTIPPIPQIPDDQVPSGMQP
jgi:hypothetical protein